MHKLKSNKLYFMSSIKINNFIFILDIKTFGETAQVALKIPSSKLIPILEMFRDNYKGERVYIMGALHFYVLFIYRSFFSSNSAICKCLHLHATPCISALLLYVELLYHNFFLRSGQQA